MFDYLKTLQQFVATSAIGPSALRGQPPGTILHARHFLSDLSLDDVELHSGYKNWLDNKTKALLLKWPVNKRRPIPSWGAARKAMNLFLRDALYNQYLNIAYALQTIEDKMEIPLDSAVAMGLTSRFPDLPSWPGLKGLTPDGSDQYQQCAELLASKLSLTRVQLDIWLWQENK